ncbi:hypothetical protein BJX66DRAFT_343151 [Aspergillus keveii]|uniref:Extracellular membrane protein CFEM domain-containing protein n=1 Tax=Aspergillus keveii TaxID=714993 RepID=A0ABR4FQ74_9EURO
MHIHSLLSLSLPLLLVTPSLAATWLSILEDMYGDECAQCVVPEFREQGDGCGDPSDESATECYCDAFPSMVLGTGEDWAPCMVECGLDAASLDYLQWAKDVDALCEWGTGVQSVSGTDIDTETATPTPTSSAEEADETDTDTDTETESETDDMPTPTSTADDATETGSEEDEGEDEQSATPSATPEETPTPTPTADAASSVSSSPKLTLLAAVLAYMGYVL